jgi:hypothetical protein
MKDPITPRIRDTRFEIGRIRLFMAVLESVIIFIFCAIILSLVPLHLVSGIPPVALGILPAFAYFAYKLAGIIRDRRTVNTIVLKYPSLDERLQTAYDNRKESNILVERLITDVSRKLDDLHSSAFMSQRGLFIRISVIVLLVFSLISINLVSIQQAGIHLRSNLENAVNGFSSGAGDGGGSGTMSMGGGKDWNQSTYSNKKELQKVGGGPGGKAPGYSEGPLAGTGGGSGEDENQNIYGAPTSARIEGQNVKMEVHPEYGGEVDIEDTRKDSDSRAYKVPAEIDSAASDPGQDPVEYEEVIKNYFDRLSREGGK